MSDTIIIPLTKGLVTIIDAADWPLVEGFKWRAAESRRGGHVYALALQYPDTMRMHRLIMGLEDRKLVVDHIDGDTLNNRRSNLRIATVQQNNVNKQTTAASVKHLRGAFLTKSGHWRARIRAHGRLYDLGMFDTEQEAHEAYLAEAAELHGEWNPLVAAIAKTTTGA